MSERDEYLDGLAAALIAPEDRGHPRSQAMSGAAEIAALITRLEAATGPDRELDAAIAGTNAATVQWHGDEETPRYTASIDAALTLVPEGWGWEVGNWNQAGDATVTHPNYNPDTYNGIQEYVTAPTPALAICIAALRAILERENRND